MDKIDARPLSDEQITAGARALCKQASDACNVNEEDNWKTYGDDFISVKSLPAFVHSVGRAWYAVSLAPTQESGAQICPHGIHYANACGSCVPPRGTT